MQALAQRFQLPLDDLHAAEPAGATDTYHFDGVYYPYSVADSDFRPVLKTLTRQNDEAPFPTTYESYTSVGWALDHLSVQQWIAAYVPGGLASRLGRLLDLAYTTEYGRDTREQSSLNLVYLLPGSDERLALYGASDERYHIRGGNQQLVRAIAQALPRGTVRTRHRLVCIERGPANTFQLRFDTPQGMLAMTAHRIIITIPFGVLRGLDYARAGFDARKMSAIAHLGYGTNAKLQLQFGSRLWNSARRNWPLSNGTSYADTGYQTTWDVTRAQRGVTGILNDYSGGSVGREFQAETPYAGADSPQVRAYADRFLRQIEPVFPGLAAVYTGTATLSVPVRDPNLLGSYSCWLVGQYTLFGGYEGVRQGKIHFAGEHCSTSFQGYMEGAAQEGARAADEILDDYRRGAFP